MALLALHSFTPAPGKINTVLIPLGYLVWTGWFSNKVFIFLLDYGRDLHDGATMPCHRTGSKRSLKGVAVYLYHDILPATRVMCVTIVGQSKPSKWHLYCSYLANEGSKYD